MNSAEERAEHVLQQIRQHVRQEAFLLQHPDHLEDKGISRAQLLGSILQPPGGRIVEGVGYTSGGQPCALPMTFVDLTGE